MLQQQEIPAGGAKRDRRSLQEEFSPLFLAMLIAVAVAGLGALVTGDTLSLTEWLKKLALTVPVASLLWAKEYVPMLSWERWKRKKAEKERDDKGETLTRERERADAERREFFQRMDERSQRTEKLLEQLVANTAPNRPGQSDQSAPEPSDASLRPGD